MLDLKIKFVAFGGFNFIKFNKNNTFEVNPIFKSQNINKIENSITLMYTSAKKKQIVLKKIKLKILNLTLYT